MRFLFRQPKDFLRRWLKSLHIQYRNPSISIRFPILFRYDNINELKFGENVCLGAFSEIVVYSKTSFSSQVGKLTIADGVSIGAHANIRAAGGEIFIGRNSLIAQGVSLIASNHSIKPGEIYSALPWDDTKTGVFIDENVWIGAGVIVLPGCSIGKNSVIGAGSVVTKNVPSNEIWIGVPARQYKSIEDIRK